MAKENTNYIYHKQEEEMKTFIQIWNSSAGTPHITFCQQNFHPIYSIEFKSAKERNKLLFEQMKKFYIEIYDLENKIIQLKAVLNGYIEDGYYGITEATPNRIRELKETIKGLEKCKKIKKEINNEIHD